MSRSFEVRAPSLKTGWLKRFVVAIGTFMPVSSKAFLKRWIWPFLEASSLPKGIKSSSWKVTPYAPRAANSFTERTGSSGARVASPKGSRACQPTVHRPKVNLSAGVGVKDISSSSFIARKIA